MKTDTEISDTNASCGKIYKVNTSASTTTKSLTNITKPNNNDNYICKNNNHNIINNNYPLNSS